MPKITEEQLAKKANTIRQNIIRMLVKAGSGHSAGPLGMADVFTALYFAIAKHRPKNPKWEDRDRIILSNGHICPVLYATLAEAGYFPKKELTTLRKFGTRLQGHPHRESLPGVETTSGPLGCGLAQAAGMALVSRLRKKNWRVYALLSDAELQEGNTWEAMMFAGKEKLDGLTAIIDRNHIQIDGFTETIMPLEPLREKIESFGWNVLEIDGHNFHEIIDAAGQAQATHEQPTMIIAHTIPGYGVDFMENNFAWHGKPPTPEEGRRALAELRSLGGKITPSHADAP